MEAALTLQRIFKSSPTHLFNLSLLSIGLFTFGCGAGAPSSAPIAAPLLQGHVHGGQQPVSGATIQLYAAGTSGYGTGATTLLSGPITTDANGNFTITSASPCPTSISQLYIVATGGNPGLSPSTNNTALALMAAIGPCVLNGGHYTLSPTAFINIDEVTTVASVYALAGFMDAATNQIGASSSNSIGIANAFQTVPNLVDISTGQALTTTPAGNGTVPQAEINTLADIIAACVNSTGSGSACTSLFTAATPANGTAPTNTLQAIFNIATHPVSQVGALYALFSATSPFQPALPSAPNDWSMQVNYSAYGALQSALAIDAVGNVWVANQVTPGITAGSVTELSNNGAILSGPTGYTGGGLNEPISIAIDPSGNAWLTSSLSTTLTKLSSTGTPVFNTTNSVIGTSPGLAIDGFGDVWCGSLAKFDNSGGLLSGSGYTGGGLGQVRGMSVDAGNNVWIASSTGSSTSSIAKFTNAGVPLSGTTGYTSTGLSGAWRTANDSGGNTWVANNGSTPSVFKLGSDGTNLSGSNGFTAGGVSNPLGIAIDGEGNVWATSDSTSFATGSPVVTSSMVELDNNGGLLSGTTGLSLVSTSSLASPVSDGIDSSGNVWVAMSSSNIVELVGAATPVVTPLSLAVRNNTLGTRP
jgi:hypothetical protein